MNVEGACIIIIRFTNTTLCANMKGDRDTIYYPEKGSREVDNHAYVKN